MGLCFSGFETVLKKPSQTQDSQIVGGFLILEIHRIPEYPFAEIHDGFSGEAFEKPCLEARFIQELP